MNLLEQIKNEVYPDSQPDYRGQERQLMWISDVSLSMQNPKDVDLLENCLYAIGRYNDFEPELFLNALLDSGFHGQVILAREGSVCIYLIGETHDELVNLVDILDADQIHNAEDYEFVLERVKNVLKADVEANRIMRLWWD